MICKNENKTKYIIMKKQASFRVQAFVFVIFIPFVIIFYANLDLPKIPH